MAYEEIEGIKHTGAIGAGQAVPSNLPPHVEIYNSTDNIRSVVRQLNELKNKLNGEDCPWPSRTGVETLECPTPSFIEVLTKTSGNISSECVEAERIIQEIQEMLF